MRFRDVGPSLMDDELRTRQLDGRARVLLDFAKRLFEIERQSRISGRDDGAMDGHMVPTRVLSMDSKEGGMVTRGSLGPLARAIDELETDYETLKCAYHDLEKENFKLYAEIGELKVKLESTFHGNS